MAAAPFAGALAVLWALALGLAELGASSVALGLSAAATWLAVRALLPAPEVALADEAAAWWEGLPRAARAAAGAAAALVAAQALFLLRNPQLGTDAVIYHLADVVAWVGNGRPGSAVDLFYALPVGNYPQAFEALSTWVAGLSDSFPIPALLGLGMFVLLATSGWLGLRTLGADRLLAGFGVAAVCSAPLVMEATRTSGTDLPALAWLAAAAALVASSARRPALLAPALIAAALGIGTKTTVAPLAVVVIAVGFWQQRRGLGAHRGQLLVAGAAAAVVGGAWYVRNLITHGSPLWPLIELPGSDPAPELVKKLEPSLLDRPDETLTGNLDEYFRRLAGYLLLLGAACVAPLLARRRVVDQPVIFCTLVLGVGSVRNAASVGKVGGLALGYFITMSTVALAIGLVVGNIIDPGEGLELNDEVAGVGKEQAAGAGSTTDFIIHIVPDSLFSSLTSGEVLQTLLVALLVGFALQAMGRQGEPILRGIGHLQRLVFRVLAMVMWAAPIGAFGAIAAVVGETGVDALKSLAVIMIAFYITCFIFVFIILGGILKIATGVNILSLFRYLAREFLLILSTSSSESALPRVIAKMEHAGVDQTTVGVVIPTGYSFNLDGTAIYLTMASIFIADAMGTPLTIGEQISLLLFMIIASKGAAGVTGAGLATLAGGLASHRPELVDGVGLIVGIDRFMSEARALTNFAGNSVATVLVGHWTQTYNREQLDRVLAGDDPFDEMTMLDEDHSEGDRANVIEGVDQPAEDSRRQ